MLGKCESMRASASQTRACVRWRGMGGWLEEARGLADWWSGLTDEVGRHGVPLVEQAAEQHHGRDHHRHWQARAHREGEREGRGQASARPT